MRNALLPIALLLCFLQGRAQPTVGLKVHKTTAEDGYVLFAPLFSKFTYLIDKCGLEVHRWKSDYGPANSVYLLENGNLLRTGDARRPGFANGGIIELLDWNSTVQWQYSFPGEQSQHHDVRVLPNGNILALVWEVKSREDAIAAGRDSTQLGQTLFTEKVVELAPDGLNGAKIIWEWDVWDHLVQDRFPAAGNFGTISAHPELLDLNYKGSLSPTNNDWIHTNGIDYNAELDQIMISVYWMNELWVIDHSTSTSEAKSHTGGHMGKGGDFLYRWGNPQAYGRGADSNQKFFRLHNAHWISSDKPDSGKVIVFNNGAGRPGIGYSSVDVFSPAMDPAGGYILGDSGNGAFEPTNFSWEYKNPVPEDFYSSFLAGADRLHNGNTLICEATTGTFFEVDNAGATVWKYVNPVAGPAGPASQGDTVTGNLVFRCEEYLPGYSGLAGRTLTPGKPIELNPPANYECFPTIPLQVASPKPAEAAILAANPFGSRIELISAGGSGHASISLIDAVGAVHASWDLELSPGGTAALQVPPMLSPGFYLLRISQGNKLTTIKLRHE